jgi:membrane-associated PAP2 superfamily phosphatase
MDLQRTSPWIVGELIVLTLAGLLAWWLFNFNPIDVEVARRFYAPAAVTDGGWPWVSVWWVRLVNDHLITIITVSAAVGSLLLWVLGDRTDMRLRFAGMFLFVSLAVGPGLVVNGVLKSEWGRPIPKDVVGLGGDHPFHYISNPGISGPPERGGDGRSFPSGHASVAFWTSAFYILLRRRRPRLAVAALCGTLAFGTLVSFTRIAAGRHFLSDVVFSGIITFAINCLVYNALLLRPAISWSAARRMLRRPFPASAPSVEP